MPTLRGITWAHTRGYAPMVATSQAFSDLHPEVEIVWEKRSLWAFGEASIEPLVQAYDLLVIDHPFIGLAAEGQWFLPLNEYVPQDLLDELATQTVGPSYRSYAYRGQQWALPVDAAAQVAASRPDLIETHGVSIPRTWNDVVDLARETRKVAIPLTPINALSAFFTLCANQGEPPLRAEGKIVAREVGEQVLHELRTLATEIDAACLDMNPIQVLNRMSSTDSILYVPLSYGYCNYSRAGYAPHRLAVHDIPAAGEFGCQGATLGGAGLAIAAQSPHRSEALAYAAWVTGANCQRNLYVLSGGQPAHRAAWEDEVANRVTGNFFRDTLRTLEAAYLRPNYPRFAAFQTQAAHLVHACLTGKEGIPEVLRELDRIYVESRAT
jgi:multiple sugar transport system substrate-binding protein